MRLLCGNAVLSQADEARQNLELVSGTLMSSGPDSRPMRAEHAENSAKVPVPVENGALFRR